MFISKSFQERNQPPLLRKNRSHVISKSARNQGALLELVRMRRSRRGTIMAKAKGNKDATQSPESIVAHFQQLRNEQRNIIAKIAELEGEKNEHK